MPTKNLVLAVYTHPEYLPPTLNALELLAKHFEAITVVHRNITGFDWVYPTNVRLCYYGTMKPVREAENQPLKKKLKDFNGFSQLLKKVIRESRPDVVLLSDYMSVLAYRLVLPFVPKPSILWYHNHDVAEKQYLRKGSLSWFGWRSERWVFPKLDIFSLPAVERKPYFPMEKLKGKFFFLPNFPSIAVYSHFKRQRQSVQNEILILYQGSIGPLHGLEQLIQVLKVPIGGKQLKLVLKGFCDPDYLKTLRDLAEVHNVTGQLEYVGPSGYTGVISNAFRCDIGIGIHMKQDIMNQTLGTASNKIFEYGACGLPVLVFDNEHFRKSLSALDWVFFTDVSPESLLLNLTEMQESLPELSKKASNDFINSVNFESRFNPVLDFIIENRKHNLN